MVPDKIYVHEISAEELTENLPYHVCYIHKDALLEWVKECYKVMENENQLSDIFKQGALYELHRVILKIESL